MAQVSLQNADEVAGEFRRQDQRSVVVAGVHAVQRRLGVVHKDPAHLVVALQPTEHQLADVDMKAQHIAAVVLAGHGHLDAAGGGGAVGVPVGQDVEPRIQAGHQAQSQHDHHGHYAGGQALPVGAENVPDLFHRSPSFLWSAAGRRRSSDRSCSARVSSARSSASLLGSSSTCSQPEGRVT